MADNSGSNGVVPDISYDDGVSTIRINSLDKKKHILGDQPGSVQYSPPPPPPPPQTGYVNAGYVNDGEVSSILGNAVAKGEIIEPVLVRERPDGDEIITTSHMYDYSQFHPKIVPQEATIYRPNQAGTNSVKVRSSNSDIGHSLHDSTSVLSSTNSILKKSGGGRRSLQQKKISWNENVRIRESEDEDNVLVTELQKEDHEYNPINEPREEVFRRDVPSENGITDGIQDSQPPNATTFTPSPPNGGIEHSEQSRASPRRVHPYGAEHFGERDDRKDDENNKWCMRITVCVLIFLLTFAVIGLVVLGLVYAWR